MAACVQVYGKERSLLETRAKVIQTGGFCTCQTMLDTELLERLRTAHCAALVLCHTLSDEEAEQASRLAKEEIPDIKIIALSKSSPAFDESLGSFVRPEELLSVLKRNLPIN